MVSECTCAVHVVSCAEVACQNTDRQFLQAFTLRVRPAVDTPNAAVDRIKMNIYTTFAKYGLPCPITGHTSGQFQQPNAEVRTNA